MSSVQLAWNVTTVGPVTEVPVPFKDLYLVQINMTGATTTTVALQLSMDGVNWWTPSGLVNISTSPDTVAYQVRQMPVLQMRLNVTAIDPGVTIAAYAANV